MSETAALAQTELAKIHSALDLLHGAVARIDITQQQMRAQVDTQAEAAQESARLHDATARALNKFTERLDAFEPGFIDKPSRGEDDLDPECEVIQGSRNSTLRPITPNWRGNTEGGTSTGMPARGASDLGGDGIMGGGAGGGGGKSHPPSILDNPGRAPLPKMSVPRFDGEWPRIWKDQILDYFHIFNMNPALWFTTGTLHLDGQAAM